MKKESRFIDIAASISMKLGMEILLFLSKDASYLLTVITHGGEVAKSKYPDKWKGYNFSLTNNTRLKPIKQ